MKYMITFRERPTGSHDDYEAAQERALSLFQRWEMPRSFKIHQFVCRVGEFSGYILVETDNPADIHLLTMAFALLECKVEPVLDIGESVKVELEAISWRKRLGFAAAA